MTPADLIARARDLRYQAGAVALLFVPVWVVMLLLKRRGRVR